MSWFDYPLHFLFNRASALGQIAYRCNKAKYHPPLVRWEGEIRCSICLEPLTNLDKLDIHAQTAWERYAHRPSD